MTKPDWANKLPEYQHWRHIPGKGWCATSRMALTWGLFIGVTEHFYSYRYCYEYEADAIRALETWDGNGDAPGPWVKRKGLGADRLNPNFTKDDKPPAIVQKGDENYDALLDLALGLALDNAREAPAPAPFESGGGSFGGGGASDSYSSDSGSSGGGE